jgi:hypothetical protein
MIYAVNKMKNKPYQTALTVPIANRKNGHLIKHGSLSLICLYGKAVHKVEQS